MIARSSFRVWLELARVSNLPTVWTNVLAGWWLAGGDWQWGTLGWLLAGASLLYTGGMFLNDAADARWDREHRSERPIATGRVSERAVWAAAVMFLLGGLAMVLIGGANGWVSLALMAAIVAYDLYHKPWKGSVLVMGLCRVLLYLTAGSAVVEGWELVEGGQLILKALVLGAYVVGLSLAARGEASGATGGWERRLGWLLLGLPAVVVMVEAVREAGFSGPVWLFAFAHGALMVWVCRLMSLSPRSNIGRAVGWLLAGIPFVDALALVRLNPMMAVGFVACVPLLRLWQRKIAAT